MVTRSTPAASASLSLSLSIAGPPPHAVGQARAMSEEGQLLDIPDPGYYQDTPPYLDASLIDFECTSMSIEYGSRAHELMMNEVVILHHDVEDYVDYSSLPTTPPVWPGNSVHRQRSAALATAMQACATRLQTQYGLRVLLQPYEFAFPAHMCQGTDADAVRDREYEHEGLQTPGSALQLPLNCSTGSPELQQILSARYKELFLRVPALDGIVATVTDSWQPRAGYSFRVLWDDSESLAWEGTALYGAVTSQDRDFVLRLWTVGRSLDLSDVIARTPKDLRLSVKVTRGDYVLPEPINPVL